MNKLIINTILLLILSLNVFGQDTTFFDSKWKVCDKETSHYFRVEIKRGDKYLRTDYFTKDDQIQMQGHYISLNPEIKIGEFKWYHANGNIKHVGSHNDNLEINEHIWYFDNGNIEAVENYVDGKLDGEFKEYHQNGKISIETSFVSGIQQGYTK